MPTEMLARARLESNTYYRVLMIYERRMVRVLQSLARQYILDIGYKVIFSPPWWQPTWGSIAAYIAAAPTRDEADLDASFDRLVTVRNQIPPAEIRRFDQMLHQTLNSAQVLIETKRQEATQPILAPLARPQSNLPLLSWNQNQVERDRRKQKEKAKQVKEQRRAAALVRVQEDQDLLDTAGEDLFCTDVEDNDDDDDGDDEVSDEGHLDLFSDPPPLPRESPMEDVVDEATIVLQPRSSSIVQQPRQRRRSVAPFSTDELAPSSPPLHNVPPASTALQNGTKQQKR